MKLILLLSSILFLSAQNIAVIVNKENTLNKLKTSVIKKIFLGKLTQWPSGLEIKAIDLNIDDRVRKIFSKEVLKKSVKKIRRYWIKKTIKGKGSPPPIFDSEASVISYIKSHKNSVGYISLDKVTADVKVIYKTSN